MAVTVAQALNGSIHRRVIRAGDPFGGGIALALVAIAVTLVGFWATFFSQLSHVDAAHMLHGTASTGWLILVLAQATLIRYRQFKWHRVIGWSSLLLLAVLLASMRRCSRAPHHWGSTMWPGQSQPRHDGKSPHV